MRIEIPDDLAEELMETARATGAEPDAVAIVALRRGLEAGEQLEHLLLPIRQAFESSGMSEDDAVELFEAEKHARRKEHRTSAS